MLNLTMNFRSTKPYITKPLCLSVILALFASSNVFAESNIVCTDPDGVNLPLVAVGGGDPDTPLLKFSNPLGSKYTLNDIRCQKNGNLLTVQQRGTGAYDLWLGDERIATIKDPILP